MEKEPKCKYCERSNDLFAVAIPIRELRRSTLYLNKDQAFRGRCIVALRNHRKELFELPRGELEDFMRDVAQAANAIAKAFSPGKINYGVFGDNAPHVHFHIVPKYKDGENWGEAFQLANPDPVFLSDSDYAEIIGSIRAYLPELQPTEIVTD